MREVGDHIIHEGFPGVIIKITDGKTIDGGYNPYRVIVRMGPDYIKKFGSGLAQDGRIWATMESLSE